ncbi:hypothetical protein VNO78_10569 [Psophocarpus tetragonolobus]|uniref:Uncharacterized protein n=1 Tax=Psophocarpus tetragonolobus TaxID=3891 RepID=A0AAN9SKA2_PSOTE
MGFFIFFDFNEVGPHFVVFSVWKSNDDLHTAGGRSVVTATQQPSTKRRRLEKLRRSRAIVDSIPRCRTIKRISSSCLCSRNWKS